MAPNMHFDLFKLHYNLIKYYYASEGERVCPEWETDFGRNQNAGDVLSILRMRLFMSFTINNTSQALTNGASQKSCEVNQQLLSRTEREMGHKKVKQLGQEDTATCGKVQLLGVPWSVLVTTSPFPPDSLLATNCQEMATNNAFGY